MKATFTNLLLARNVLILLTLIAGISVMALNVTNAEILTGTNLLYHYRVIGGNANGTTNGTDMTFTTMDCIPPVITISGPTPVCVGSTGNVYTTQTGNFNYTWTVSPGGTITSGTGTSSIIVTWNTAGAQNVSVNYTNASGCSALNPTVYPVTVNPLPVPTISGPASVCAGSTGNVYTTQNGMTSYIWTVSAGGTITAGGDATSNTVTVTWNTLGAQTVSLNYTNANGCTASIPTVYNVTVNPSPIPTIAGPTPVCAGSTGNVYITQAGMTGYLWVISAGGTITSGAGTKSITVTWNTAGAKTVNVNYTNANGCPALIPTVYNVTVSPGPCAPIPTLSQWKLIFLSFLLLGAGIVFILRKSL